MLIHKGNAPLYLIIGTILHNKVTSLVEMGMTYEGQQNTRQLTPGVVYCALPHEHYVLSCPRVAGPTPPAV